MCGRFSQGEPSHRISDYFGAYPDDDLPEGLYNVPPTETIRMVVEREGERRLTAAKWGFRPFWADRVDGSRRSWINARAETAAISPAFGPALRTHRCVIPADAFYEWDRATSPRQPYAIGPAAPGAQLAMAGIWAPMHGALPSVAILTTRPNALVERIHNRMPVILDRELLDAWLDPAATLADVEPMLAPASEASVRIWPVGSAVNRVGTDGPELLERVEVPRTLGLV
ncbi:MAG: SOS response-associated peptidase [Chloroflexota bacterium]|nr:SOS response-associated peptidase [Chloroflexota bacterium]